MKRAVAVLLCAVLATGSITSCQSKKSETAASSSVKEEYGKSRECINRYQNRYKIRR